MVPGLGSNSPGCDTGGRERQITSKNDLCPTKTISEHHPEVSLSKIDPTANSCHSMLSKQLDQFNAAYSICSSVQYSIYIYYIDCGTVGIFSYNHFPNPTIILWEFVHNKAHRVRVPKCRSHEVCEISCWSPP